MVGNLDARRSQQTVASEVGTLRQQLSVGASMIMTRITVFAVGYLMGKTYFNDMTKVRPGLLQLRSLALTPPLRAGHACWTVWLHRFARCGDVALRHFLAQTHRAQSERSYAETVICVPDTKSCPMLASSNTVYAQAAARQQRVAPPGGPGSARNNQRRSHTCMSHVTSPENFRIASRTRGTRV